VRGQISDLDWSLIVVEPAPGAPADFLMRAHELANGTGATLIVHFARLPSGGFELSLVDPLHDRVVSRRIDGALLARPTRSAISRAMHHAFLPPPPPIPTHRRRRTLARSKPVHRTRTRPQRRRRAISVQPSLRSTSP